MSAERLPRRFRNKGILVNVSERFGGRKLQVAERRDVPGQRLPGALFETREEALRLYTVGSSWFSGEDGTKGAIISGQLADLVVTSEDYFTIPEERIKDLQSVLTIVDGKPVYAAGTFREYDPPAIPVLPEWSPVATFGGYGAPLWNGLLAPPRKSSTIQNNTTGMAQLWGSGCDCFAF